jgi:hypothetical protein
MKNGSINAAGEMPHPEERLFSRVSKDEAIKDAQGASWFETPLRGSSP